MRALTNNLFTTNCTTLWYESMWTIQVRVYLRTYEDHKSQYSMVYRYQYLATSVLWLYYEYFFCFRLLCSLASKALQLLPLWKALLYYLFLRYRTSIFLLKRMRWEFRILLHWFVLVDTRPHPAVQRCPDAKTDFDGKDLFNVAQAEQSISGSKGRFLL